MKRDTRSTIHSSFLSYEKDVEKILRKLFIETYPYSDILKKLLVINTQDCLENESQIIVDKIAEMTLPQLVKEGYIRLVPKIKMPEHEETKAYIIISFDNITPSIGNGPFYRDFTINFDILCHTDYWYLGDYRIRPLKIAGYIDGILNEAKLSGIGTLNFIGLNELVLNEDLSGYTLSYRAVHGNDDNIPSKE